MRAAWWWGALAVAAGLTALSCQMAPSRPSPAAAITPSPDAATVAYRSMVDIDINTLDVQFFKKYTCKTRDLCISELQDVRSTALALIADLSKAPAPPVFTEQAAAVNSAAQAFVAQIDATLAVMRRPGSDYVAASSTPSIVHLDLATGVIVCWPKKAVLVNQTGYSASGFLCT